MHKQLMTLPGFNVSFCVRILSAALVNAMLILLCPALTGCSGTNAEHDQATKNRLRQTTALTLIKNDDCLSCHSIEDKSAGPSYVRIAQRYEADLTTVNRLADKVIEGGGGLWGGAQMTEHPFLKKEDARKIVRWILSLDDTVVNRNPIVTTPGIMLTNVFQREPQSSKNGLVVKAYDLEQLDSGGEFPKIPQNASPMYSGIVQAIHFPRRECFEPLQNEFVLKATGFITIKQHGTYFFKQVKAGAGRVMLNEAIIINENDWDTEVDIELSPGTYPITIEYLADQGSKALSLQWITPEDEYYRVIPGDVFTFKQSRD